MPVRVIQDAQDRLNEILPEPFRAVATYMDGDGVIEFKIWHGNTYQTRGIHEMYFRDGFGDSMLRRCCDYWVKVAEGKAK